MTVFLCRFIELIESNECSNLEEILLLDIRMQVANWLGLLILDHGVTGSNPTGNIIKYGALLQKSLSLSPFHHLHMTCI